MLKVADLQQLIQGLIQPVRVAGASEKVCGELQRAAECLEPFKNSTVAEFNDFLVKAEECVRTDKWPAPGKRSSSRKSGSGEPAMSVEQAAQRLMGLLERANDSGMDEAAIEAELAGLESLQKPDLLKAAQEVGMSIASRNSKQEIVAEIRRRVQERKGSFERSATPAGSVPSLNAQPAEPRREHGQPQHQPVGASHPGNP
jgi:hypothetical protein